MVPKYMTAGGRCTVVVTRGRIIQARQSLQECAECLRHGGMDAVRKGLEIAGASYLALRMIEGRSWKPEGFDIRRVWTTLDAARDLRNMLPYGHEAMCIDEFCSALSSILDQMKQGRVVVVVAK